MFVFRWSLTEQFLNREPGIVSGVVVLSDPGPVSGVDPLESWPAFLLPLIPQGETGQGQPRRVNPLSRKNYKKRICVKNLRKIIDKHESVCYS